MPITEVSRRAARTLERQIDGELTYESDPLLESTPKYKVYIFNVGPMEHKVEKGSAGTFIVPACEKGEELSKPLVLPSIHLDSYQIEGIMKTHKMKGEDLAQDIVHPNIGGDWSFGQNLDDLGVFWTRNEKPIKKEVDAARGKMEATFRKILAEATKLETSGKLNDITPLMRLAADYFGEDRSWNKIYRKMEECPSCGGPIKSGIAVHSCGAVLDWDKAIKFGQKTYDDAVKAGVKPKEIK